jgi:YD repeat-containing protein
MTLGLTGAALALGLTGTAMTGGLTDAAISTHHIGPVVTQHEAVAWGDGSCGELGNGATTGSAQWTGVSGLGGNVAQVSAGSCHGLAVKSDGTVWAWGGNFAGALGNGTTGTTPQATPIQVTGLTGVTQVAAGYLHSLALRSDGTVWAWGSDDFGEIGNGTIGHNQTTPVQVVGLTNVVKIAAGGYFSLALRSDGTVWAWGENNTGQLGDGSTINSPVPVQVSGLSRVTNISAGDESSLATRLSGIRGVTTVWAWGNNDLGQLGDGTTITHYVPELMNGINMRFGASVAGIAAGNDHSVVLGNDGSVWGWGDNAFGELGTVDVGQHVTQPVQVIAAGSGYTQISAGGGATVAVRSDGTAWAWGYDQFGQLGDGTWTDSPVPAPVQVVALTNVTQVSAGGYFGLAIHTVPLQIQP